VDCLLFSSFKGFGDLVITPVIPKTPNNLVAPAVNNKPNTEVASHWSRVGRPTLEDYVLMKEDTFTVDSSYFDNNNRYDISLIFIDKIIFHVSLNATFSG
jgi:hypothetical protein